MVDVSPSSAKRQARSKHISILGFDPEDGSSSFFRNIHELG
jgi:hypothetical protein